MSQCNTSDVSLRKTITPLTNIAIGIELYPMKNSRDRKLFSTLIWLDFREFNASTGSIKDWNRLCIVLAEDS